MTDTELWEEAANRILKAEYGLSLWDAGFGPLEFFDRWGGDASPEDAVHAFAEKYDLVLVKGW
jgi:hypothetical protein